MFYTIIFYQNGDAERVNGLFPYTSCIQGVKFVAEYMGEGNLINCFNPNDN